MRAGVLACVPIEMCLYASVWMNMCLRVGKIWKINNISKKKKKKKMTHNITYTSSAGNPRAESINYRQIIINIMHTGNGGFV